MAKLSPTAPSASLSSESMSLAMARRVMTRGSEHAEARDKRDPDAPRHACAKQHHDE
jgi:hypothetical protein